MVRYKKERQISEKGTGRQCAGKKRTQTEISTPTTEMGKTKLTITVGTAAFDTCTWRQNVLEAKSNFTLLFVDSFFGYRCVIFIKCLIYIEV